MYKLIEPFQNHKIYKKSKKNAIEDIYKDLKYFKANNVMIKIQDIQTGNYYSYFILNKKNLINYK